MVSVIIPSFNREKTIGRAVKSVLEQTYTDIEVIVVDDGSNDRTREIIEQFEDNRIHYIYQENKGACFSRNHGIDVAKGEYIAFQDSDDYWVQDKLEKQLNLMHETDSAICFGKVHRYGQPEGLPEFFPEKVDYNGKIEYANLISTPQVTTQTIIAKAEVFNNVKFCEYMPALQDYEWCIRAGKKYKCCILAKDPCVEQYYQMDSITYNSKKIYDAYSILANKYENLWMNNINGMGLNFYYDCMYWAVKNGVNDRNAAKKIYMLTGTFKDLIKLLLVYCNLYQKIMRCIR